MPKLVGYGDKSRKLTCHWLYVFEEPLVRWKASRLAGDKCPAEREGYVAYVAVCSHIPEIEKHTFKAYNHLSWPDKQIELSDSQAGAINSGNLGFAPVFTRIHSPHTLS